MASCAVLGIGALNWDLIYELPELALLDKLGIKISLGEEIHLCQDRLDPLLALLDRFGEKRAESGGGQAANTVYALARMGFKAGMIGKVGKDDWGERILQSLNGVDLSYVLREDRSGICISILTPDGERSMIAFPNVNDTLDKKDLDLSALSGCRFLHLTSFAGSHPLQTQIEVVEGLGDVPRISFDPGNLYASLGLNAILPIVRKTYCLFATANELERITGLGHEDASALLLDLGVKIVICKQGARGAYLVDRHKRLTFAPAEAEVKDVTGAGDCFAAGFLAGLLKGMDLEKCGQLGTYAAASCISGYGRESYPDQETLGLVIEPGPLNHSSDIIH
ncbi:MAG: carbohydrate kinase family protein [bacterium]